MSPLVLKYIYVWPSFLAASTHDGQQNDDRG